MVLCASTVTIIESLRYYANMTNEKKRHRKVPCIVNTGAGFKSRHFDSEILALKVQGGFHKEVAIEL